MHIVRWVQNFGEDSCLILQDYPEDDTSRIPRNIGFYIQLWKEAGLRKLKSSAYDFLFECGGPLNCSDKNVPDHDVHDRSSVSFSPTNFPVLHHI
jgi:hypothetical protein